VLHQAISPAFVCRRLWLFNDLILNQHSPTLPDFAPAQNLAFTSASIISSSTNDLLANKRPREQTTSSTNGSLSTTARPPPRETITSSDSKTSCPTPSHGSQCHISQCIRPLDGFIVFAMLNHKLIAVSLSR